jgi:hypothetical protein
MKANISATAIAPSNFEETGETHSGVIAGIVGGILGGFLFFCIALVVLFVRRSRRKVSFSSGAKGVSGVGVGIILDQSRLGNEKVANIDRDRRLSIWGDASGDL